MDYLAVSQRQWSKRMQDDSSATSRKPGIERRLATIMMADVAGYSRMMGENEEGTIAVLRGPSGDLRRTAQGAPQSRLQYGGCRDTRRISQRGNGLQVTGNWARTR